MALSDFKEFVKSNPKLIDFVRNKEMTWQGFYELYDLYGSKNEIWNKYLGITNNGIGSFKDIFNNLKGINMNELQSGITSIQKGIGYVQEFISNKTSNVRKEKEEYEPRPIHKYFDD